MKHINAKYKYHKKKKYLQVEASKTINFYCEGNFDLVFIKQFYLVTCFRFSLVAIKLKT